jgi:dipeptidyl aminopeptidase/acylaminoacyl peptidase
MKLACVAFLALLTAAAGLGGARAAPLEAYGRLPAIDRVVISPDGANLAYAVTEGEKRMVVVRRLSDKAVLGAINVGDVKLRDLQWAGSGHLLVTRSVTAFADGVVGRRREYFMVEDFDLATRRQRNLLDGVPDAMNIVYGSPVVRMVGGAPVVFMQGVGFFASRGRLVLFRIDLTTLRTVMLESRYEDAEDWVIDADGVPIAQSEYNEKSGRWTLRMKARQNDAWVSRAVIDAPTNRPGLYGLGRDGHTVLVSTLSDQEDQSDYVEYAPGALGAAPATLEGVSGDVIHDPVSKAPIGDTALVGDDYRYNFFSPKDQSVWRSVSKAFPGHQVILTSWSDDRRKIVVQVDGVEGPAFALVNLDTGRADWLGEIYPGLGNDGVSEVRSIRYKAADGLEITGYLTLPKGRDPKSLPLIVLTHGGPAARDEPGFDWWAQALASRGYAVLQPNYRGSEGFGRKFMEAGYGQWGRKMQTDLSDGVRDLAAKGIIDPKRVCIVGASYGGYAALAGAALDTGVYRCAASVSGPADLKRFLQWGQQDYGGDSNFTLRYWTQFMGVGGIKDPDLAAISPAGHADAVTIPILLVHGKDDTVVPYEQSRIMADALKRAGKPVTFVTLDGEDHWLSRGATRLQMLQTMTGFLEANNPPK